MATKTALPDDNGAESLARTAELQAQKAAIAPKRSLKGPKKVQNEGLLASVCTLVCDHQLGTSLAIPELTHSLGTDHVYRHYH
jgi:acyl-CoA-dependent ceramide synthase